MVLLRLKIVQRQIGTGDFLERWKKIDSIAIKRSTLPSINRLNAIKKCKVVAESSSQSINSISVVSGTSKGLDHQAADFYR